MPDKKQFPNRVLMFATILLFSAIAACSESGDRDAGYNDGYADGVADALACVERQGGNAEDAAEYCDRNL